MNNARRLIPVLIVAIWVGVLALYPARAADLIGNWDGEHAWGKTSAGAITSNSGDYVKFYGDKIGTFGGTYPMATLRLWNQSLVFSASGANNDSSGELQIDRWLGSGATFVWSVANDSAANDDSLTVTVEMKNSSGCSWYTVLTLANGDSAQVVEGTTFIDSLDFANPALRHPYMRIYLDGKGIAAGKTKYTKFTGDLTLFRPTQ